MLTEAERKRYAYRMTARGIRAGLESIGKYGSGLPKEFTRGDVRRIRAALEEVAVEMDGRGGPGNHGAGFDGGKSTEAEDKAPPSCLELLEVIEDVVNHEGARLTPLSILEAVKDDIRTWKRERTGKGAPEPPPGPPVEIIKEGDVSRRKS